MTWFALGTFDRGQGPFAGLVLGDDAVHPLAAGTTVRGLVDRWDEELPRLQGLADRLAGADVPYRLAELRALPPVSPAGQVFQAEANFTAVRTRSWARATRRPAHRPAARPRRARR